MAKSFAESKTRLTAQKEKPTIAEASAILTAESDETELGTSDFTAYSGDKYATYSEYVDENYSYVDFSTKLVTVDKTQINLTQERNSQLIPFEMPRYYDGIDLLEMMILVHYVNAESSENYCDAVNVSYSDDTIHFCWLVDSSTTAIAGTLYFEILIMGETAAGKYVFRTRPNSELTVIQSLDGNGTTTSESSSTIVTVGDISGITSDYIANLFSEEAE